MDSASRSVLKGEIVTTSETMTSLTVSIVFLLVKR
jgi:hypothetical protein